MRLPTLLALPAALVLGCGYVRPPDSMCERFPCAPYVLAQGEKDPRDVTVNAVDVYWADAGNGHLRRWGKQDGELESVTMSGVGAKGLALDDGYVYFGRRDGSVVRLNLGVVPMPEVVSQGWAEGRRLVSQAEYLYWSVPQGVGRAAKVGGLSEPLALVDDPSEVAADASGVYFGAPGALFRVPPGEQPEPEVLALVPKGMRVASVALDPEGVWAALAPVSGAGPCHLVRTAREPLPDGAVVATALESGPDCPVDLAADGTHVYALVRRAQDGHFELRRHARPDLPDTAPVVRGKWEVLSTPRESAGRLALDDTHAYWNEPQGGRVVRLAKEARRTGTE